MGVLQKVYWGLFSIEIIGLNTGNQNKSSWFQQKWCETLLQSSVKCTFHIKGGDWDQGVVVFTFYPSLCFSHLVLLLNEHTCAWSTRLSILVGVLLPTVSRSSCEPYEFHESSSLQGVILCPAFVSAHRSDSNTNILRCVNTNITFSNLVFCRNRKKNCDSIKRYEIIIKINSNDKLFLEILLKIDRYLKYEAKTL